MKTILLLMIALCNVSALVLALIYTKLTNKIIKRHELKELHLEDLLQQERLENVEKTLVIDKCKRMIKNYKENKYE
jgi:Na+-translocating ferredoxin:NAD+ oxidoreductase RnfG subunit